MKPERWQQASQILEIALERDPLRRAAYLDEVCVNDDELRREVESLLAASERAGSLLDSPAMQMAAPLFVNDSVESMIGRSIGRYEIISELGAGGMGEVYLAHDTRLGRKIALKLLPIRVTTDKDRLRRFEQEAHAASTLSHPNVCVIHEVGESENGYHYIAMEFVDGVTLRQHLAGGPLKTTEALDVAMQVAAALEAAHRVGIVHRDVKPENVMVRPDGFAKVLDFGLAKLTSPPTVRNNKDPSAAGVFETRSGMIMGTTRYMSPEQARGLAVDARSDIWSLGVVLYETLAGCAPFAGDTDSDVMVSILEREPLSLTRHLPEVPAELQRIVSKALRKDREERYQVVKDMLFDVKSLRQELEFEAKLAHSVHQNLSSGEKHAIQAATETSTQTNEVQLTDPTDAFGLTAPLSSLELLKSPPARGDVIPGVLPHARLFVRRLILLVLLPVLVIAGGVFLYLWRHAPKSSLPTMKVVPFTTEEGDHDAAAFSPDGNQIAFSWRGEKNDNMDIYVKSIGGERPLRLTTRPGPDAHPTWSPDGQTIAFVRNWENEWTIFTVPALGGTERKLLSLGPTLWDGWPSLNWSPDGKFIASSYRGSKQEPASILLFSLETGEKRTLTSAPAPSGGDYCPVFSPDSQTLVFLRYDSFGQTGPGDLYLLPIAGGQPKRLTFDNAHVSRAAWTPDGSEIIFSSSRLASPIAHGFLWRIPVVGGTPERVVVGGDRAFSVAVSGKGHRLAYTQWNGKLSIDRLELPTSKGQPSVPVGFVSSTEGELAPQFSPDGQRVAFSSDRSGNTEIWTCNSDGSNPSQLTFLGEFAGSPRWSPDGRQIAFDVNANGDLNIYLTSAEGGPPRRLTTDPADDYIPSWSRDGRWIYFASKRSGDFQVWKMPSQGGAAVQLTRHGGFAAFESPDGKFVYYIKNSEVNGIWQVPVEGGEETLLFESLNSSWWGNWAVVSDGIYFVSSKTTDDVSIEFFSFATHRIVTITKIAGLKRDMVAGVALAVSPDRRSILFGQAVGFRSGSLVLVENFQ